MNPPESSPESRTGRQLRDKVRDPDWEGPGEGKRGRL